MLKKATGINVYYLAAPINVEYPYIVFNVRERYLTEGLYMNSLSVDIYATDIKTADTIEDKVKTINDTCYTDRYVSFDVELNTVNTLKDESIYHINLLFYLDLY